VVLTLHFLLPPARDLPWLDFSAVSAREYLDLNVSQI